MTDPTPLFFARPIMPFLFVGNDDCLDFLNTLIVDRGQPTDLIQTFDDFLRWLIAAKMLDMAIAADLAGRWHETVEASATLTGVRALRKQLLAMVEGLIAGNPLPSDVIDALNAILQRRVGYEQLAPGDPTAGQWAIERRYAYREPRDLLAPVAHAAAMLLAERDSGRIKMCENPACVLHYYDTSKNGSRRWCDTRVCGNRIRVAHHYQRQHSH
ncbi:MAG TPA: ABATE domain-containing protein [Ktedonobacterales bacterium]|jgi:predicted RNA-binding Zn ribbon-like protein